MTKNFLDRVKLRRSRSGVLFGVCKDIAVSLHPLTDASPDVETRRNGDKTLPAFTLHFAQKELPILRDMLSKSSIERAGNFYSELVGLREH